MKKNVTILLAGIFVSLSSLSKAQQFWIENWTSGTGAQGTLTYTGPNGAWSVQQTGTNGADSNAWYFSNEEEGMGRGICGQSGAPKTAHMGNTINAPLLGLGILKDNGAVIDDGPGTTTNLRLQSPTISCTGKSNITLSFNYIEGKSAGNDFVTLWYYNGTAWTLLSTPAELDSCSSGGQGLWTYYSIALPVSANNNANVKIGFNWTNNAASYDDDAYTNSSSATDNVSFAVDSILLSTPVTVSKPIANFTENDTLVCVGDTVHFTDLSSNTPTSWKWYFQNGNPTSSTFQNPEVVYNTPGTDSVKLVVKNSSGSDSVTRKLCIYVLARPVASITGTDTICKGDPDVLMASGGTTYLWSNTATTSSITVTPTTNTTYTVMVGNGACSTSDTLRVIVNNCGAGINNITDNNSIISIYPNPANNTINLAFTKAISGNAKIDITDITGRLISTQVLNASAGKTITMDVSGMATGMYIVKVTVGNSVYFEKFIKQ